MGAWVHAQGTGTQRRCLGRCRDPRGTCCMERGGGASKAGGEGEEEGSKHLPGAAGLIRHATKPMQALMHASACLRSRMCGVSGPSQESNP